MCVNGRFVTNKYTGSRFFAKCGHCKSCLQEKANSRANRIRSEYSSDRIVLFVTLTYDRFSCPYVRQDDLVSKPTELNVYRAYNWKWNVNKNKYVRSWSPAILSTHILDDSDYFGFASTRWLKFQPHKVGVCYYPDFQNFCKRLRENLKHNYNYAGKFKIFGTSEYGETTSRPHFHALIFAQSGTFSVYRDAIIKSWQFGNHIADSKSIQVVTDDPSSYVSAYVNSGSKLSPFLAHVFPPKHSHSKLFGHGRSVYQLDSVLSLLDRGTTRVSFESGKGANRRFVDIPLPKYVINRYFPLFKGYSRLAVSAVRNYLRGSAEPINLWQLGSEYDWYNLKHPIAYTDEDLHKISVRLHNAFGYYHRVTGKSWEDYAIDYQRAWNIHKSTIYRTLLEDEEVNSIYKYDNLIDYLDQKDYTLSGDVLNRVAYDGTSRIFIDPNKFPQNINKTCSMSTLYDLKCKQKKVTNIVMSENGIFV